MSKNKGGREVRKPKQVKAPKSATPAVEVPKVATSGKARPPR